MKRSPHRAGCRGSNQFYLIYVNFAAPLPGDNYSIFKKSSTKAWAGTWPDFSMFVYQPVTSFSWRRIDNIACDAFITSLLNKAWAEAWHAPVLPSSAASFFIQLSVKSLSPSGVAEMSSSRMVCSRWLLPTFSCDDCWGCFCCLALSKRSARWLQYSLLTPSAFGWRSGVELR